MIARRYLLSLATLALGGCSLGPSHPAANAPLPPTGAGNASTAPIAPVSGPVQRIETGMTVPASWWRQFGSGKLDDLVDRALIANNDLKVADANLRQAGELAKAAGGAALPQADASYQVQRARISDTISPPLADADKTLYTLHTAQLSVGYSLDLFGGVRSKILSARAAADVARYRFHAAQTMVIANLVLAVVQQASLAAQIEAARDAVRINRDLLAMLRQRQALGAIGAADVAAQETALATAQGLLPPIARALAHQQALIAQLTGTAPGNPLPPLPTLDELGLPTALPMSLPADLVRRRPDILAADAQMRGAAADVGTAIAARLPAIQLSATVGGAATRFSQMFTDGNPFWTLIGGVTQPLFHGGTLRHQQKAAEAALDAAKAQYRAAVIQAFVDISDALTGLQGDADALDAATSARDAAARNLRFVTRQLQLGDVGTLALLNASAANAQAATQHVQARAARLSDSVALFQAMGGSQ